MGQKTARYVVITPVRNEEKLLPRTIDSVTKQSRPPTEWVIVNDGSTDQTADIIDHAALHFAWIRTVHRVDRGFRKSGGGVVEAFSDGLRALREEHWEFIVKLDGDLSFDEFYFDKCLKRFSENERLGVGGGTIYSEVEGKIEIESHPRFHVRGATKIYRRACWEDLGGLWPAPGWDTLDEVKASMCGWETYTFHDLALIQHRATGKADGAWKDSVKNGRANYISGYHPLFMTAKVLKRAFKRPFAVNAWGLAFGFAGGYVRQIPRIDDPALIQYLRSQQLARLFGRPTIWR